MSSWKPFYHELAGRVLEYADRHEELVEVLREAKKKGLMTVSLTDKDSKSTTVALNNIDPFTFFANFNRGIKPENARALLAFFKQKFNLSSPVPTDFDGLPTVNSQASWFFAWQYERGEDDISTLWRLATVAYHNGPDAIDQDLWGKCLKIKSVGLAKLTIGLFYINPDRYIALDSNTRTYLAKREISTTSLEKIADYVSLMQQVEEKLGDDLVKISLNAYKHTEPNDGKEAHQSTNEPSEDLFPNRRYWAGGFRWNGNESHLNEFMDGNYWQLGWSRDSPERAAKATWKIYDQIAVGDEFAIKGYGGRNSLNIHYIGIVESKAPEQGKLLLKKIGRPIAAHGKRPGGAGTGNWYNTLVPVRLPEMIDWVFYPGNTTPPVLPPPPEDPEPLNQILYGPPGTGKTYSTVERAVRMVDLDDAEDYKASKERWDELRHDGQIEFVTFHQSYGYEDFVEGLRPVMDSESSAKRGGVARYEIRSGVLKSIALRALEAILERIPVPVGTSETEEAPHIVLFDALWNEFLGIIRADSDKHYTVHKNAEFKMRPATRGGIRGINVATNQKNWSYACGKPNARQVWDVLGNKENPTVRDVEDVIKVGAHYTFILAVLKALQKLRNELQNSGEAETFLQPQADSEDGNDAALQYLRFGEESGNHIIPDRAKWPHYVLVIDEINRGNISKIFGELITLLEDDKRIGNDHALTATLPYSQDPFGLPANLHILGTMNTADKSIALVDIALRRRFDFEELRPDFSICSELSDDMRNVLKRLNERILLRKDRDHRIGHAFFMGVKGTAPDRLKAFNTIFERKILPLLGEYFYGDWDGLRAVLGDSGDNGGFVRKINSTDTDFRGQRNAWQWYFDSDGYVPTDGKAPFDSLSMLMKNYKIPKQSTAAPVPDATDQ